MSFVFEIQSIQLLSPDLKEEYCLTIIINNSIPFKSNFFRFSKKSNIQALNQKFELKTEIKTVKVQIFPNVSSPSNPIFKGENEHFEDISSAVIHKNCDLLNNNNEKCGELSYDFTSKPKALNSKKESSKEDSNQLDDFDENLKKIQKELDHTEINQKKKRQTSSILDLASGSNAENFTLFVHNMNYFQCLLNEIMNVFLWKNFWKTITILSIWTSFILYNQLFVLIILPIVLMMFHLSNKDHLLKEYSHKNAQSDKAANMKLIMWIIELTNATFTNYENVLKILQTSNTELIQEAYGEILKLVGYNILLYFSNMLSLINMSKMIVFGLWGGALYLYPPFRAFGFFLFNFLRKNIGFKKDNNANIVIGLTIHFLYIIVPFLNLVIRIKSAIREKEIEYTMNEKRSGLKPENRVKLIIDVLDDLSKSSNKSTMLVTGNCPPNSLEDQTNSNNNINTAQVVKYEIYENERWWVALGWCKKMILDEIPLWCSVNKPKNYCDKNMIFLKDNERWTSDWKIESNEDCDSNGWEYGNNSFDPKVKFGQKGANKYVRRRKWVRYAQKME